MYYNIVKCYQLPMLNELLSFSFCMTDVFCGEGVHVCCCIPAAAMMSVKCLATVGRAIREERRLLVVAALWRMQKHHSVSMTDVAENSLITVTYFMLLRSTCKLT